jgi:hypothetical protein
MKEEMNLFAEFDAMHEHFCPPEVKVKGKLKTYQPSA